MSDAVQFAIGLTIGMVIWLVVRGLLQEMIVDAWHHLTYNRRIKREAKRWARKRHR